MEALNPSLQPRTIRYLAPLMNYTSENYTAPEYEVMRSILRSHYQPRFGHNNDFGDLLSDNTEQQKDYILGVLIGSIIIFAVALILFAVIIGLKIAGQDRVGFLAGRFVKYTPRDRLTTEDSIDDLVDEEERIDGPRVIDQTVEKRNALSNRACIAVRLMFVLSGIIIIVFTGIFYGKGVDSFRRSFAEVRKGIEVSTYVNSKLADLGCLVLILCFCVLCTVICSSSKTLLIWASQ
jgi:hypothetical protein